LSQTPTAVSTAHAFSGTHFRVLQQTAGGQQQWGVLLQRRFANPLDIHHYSHLSFQLWCEEQDTERTLGVELVTEGNNVYSLKKPQEVPLQAAHGKLLSISVPLETDQWQVATRNAPWTYDATKIMAINFVLCNHDAVAADRTLFFDDIKLEASVHNGSKSMRYSSTIQMEPVSYSAAGHFQKPRSISVTVGRIRV